MKTIYLTGFMGAGKTTVGKLVADFLDVRFVDMDEVIVETEGISINEIFNRKGEPYFRDLESQVLQELSVKESAVISTGGGCVESAENRDLMSLSGTVFFIDTPWAEIQERLKKATDRPLASSDDGWRKTGALFENRYPLYCTADYIIKAERKTPAEIAREIAALVN